MKSRSFLKLLCPMVLAAAFTTSAQAVLTGTTSYARTGWTVYTFTDGSGTWDVPAGATVMEVLVIGGGGATSNYSSGAGAGGMYSTSTYTPTGNVSVTVGAGGIADNGGGTGLYGGNSHFGSIIAYGGQGIWGYRDAGDPTQSSSVHGGNQGGYSTNNGGTITAGNLGGFAEWDGAFDSGAGAGAAGTHGNNAAGGIGMQDDITGTNIYYAGGGGAYNNGPGGQGGGGTGGQEPTAGLANTGGGGGGGWEIEGANGGSGVVIVALYGEFAPLSSIPEPSSILALGCLVGSGLMLRNRRRK